MKGLTAGAAIVIALGMGATAAHAVVITEIGGGSDWEDGGTTADATAGIVGLTGEGGNLENDAPLPNGALRLTTGDSNSSRAEVRTRQDFGLVSDIFTDDLSFSYSLFKGTTGADEPAPALKLEFYNPAAIGDGYAQLVFEPYWNQSGSIGSSSAVPEEEWLDYTIDLDTGVLWNTGGFGVPSGAGGPPLNTLSEWESAFNDEFLSASLIGVSVGLGTYNPNQIGYADNVAISGTASDATYDFETAAQVPEPATIGLMGIGLAGIGFAARRRRRA